MSGGLLALDLARSTGWCYAPPLYRSPAFAVPDDIYSLLESGYMVFGTANDTHGRLFLTAHTWLDEMIRQWRPAIIAIERPFIPVLQFRGAGVGIGLAAFVKMHAAMHNLPLYEASPMEIKRYWTGDGHAKKARMMEWCQKRGLSPAREDEADAVALCDFQVATLTNADQWPPRGSHVLEPRPAA